MVYRSKIIGAKIKARPSSIADQITGTPMTDSMDNRQTIAEAPITQAIAGPMGMLRPQMLSGQIISGAIEEVRQKGTDSIITRTFAGVRNR